MTGTKCSPRRFIIPVSFWTLSVVQVWLIFRLFHRLTVWDLSSDSWLSVCSRISGCGWNLTWYLLNTGIQRQTLVVVEWRKWWYLVIKASEVVCAGLLVDLAGWGWRPTHDPVPHLGAQHNAWSQRTRHGLSIQQLHRTRHNWSLTVHKVRWTGHNVCFSVHPVQRTGSEHDIYLVLLAWADGLLTPRLMHYTAQSHCPLCSFIGSKQTADMTFQPYRTLCSIVNRG
jgi:hypothetical protein